MAKRLVVLGLAVLFCVFLWNAPKVSGQAVFGSIIGTVTDPQGNAVVGAKVLLLRSPRALLMIRPRMKAGIIPLRT